MMGKGALASQAQRLRLGAGLAQVPALCPVLCSDLCVLWRKPQTAVQRFEWLQGQPGGTGRGGWAVASDG